jgi:hypothetical protein
VYTTVLLLARERTALMIYCNCYCYCCYRCCCSSSNACSMLRACVCSKLLQCTARTCACMNPHSRYYDKQVLSCCCSASRKHSQHAIRLCAYSCQPVHVNLYTHVYTAYSSVHEVYTASNPPPAMCHLYVKEMTVVCLCDVSLLLTAAAAASSTSSMHYC